MMMADTFCTASLAMSPSFPVAIISPCERERAGVISAMEEVEVSQKVAMTGSLSVRGQVLPVGAVTAKCEAAAEAGMTKVLIPLANARDVLIDDKYKDQIEIIFVDDIIEVLRNALAPGPKRDKLIQKLTAMMPKSTVTLARPPSGLPAPQG